MRDPRAVLFPTAGILAGVTLLLLLVGTGCGRPRGQVAREFDRARESLTSGRFPEAIERLHTFLTEHPHHPLASRASFLLAKAYLGDDDISRATEWFESTMQRFPGSEEAHKSQYKLAILLVLQEENDKAIPLFRTMVEVPDGPLAGEANAWLQFLERRQAAVAP
jgi:TolA-binding protein